MTTTRVIFWVLGIAFIGCLMTSVMVGAVFYFASDSLALVSTESWDSTPWNSREFSKTFGIQLAGHETEFKTRSLGFQDPYLEALFLVPDESSFLTGNHLTIGERVSHDSATTQATDEISKMKPGITSIDLFSLEGIEDEIADAGYLVWARNQYLIRVTHGTKMESFVLATAFGT